MNALADLERHLAEKIRPAVAHFAPGVDPDAAEALAHDIMADALGLALWGLERGIRASHEPAMGEVVWRSIMRTAGEPNTVLIPGQSRQRTAKAIARVRHNLGLPPEMPKRSHPKRSRPKH